MKYLKEISDNIIIKIIIKRKCKNILKICFSKLLKYLMEKMCKKCVKKWIMKNKIKIK